MHVRLGRRGCPAPPCLRSVSPPSGGAVDGKKRGSRKLVTGLWAPPGFAWLALYLIAPLVFIVLVSFWTYEQGVALGLHDRLDAAELRRPLQRLDVLEQHAVELHDVRDRGRRRASSSASGRVLPRAEGAERCKWQIALFIVALAPFWTSFLTRSIAWTYPLMGREGALNQVLTKLGIVDEPIAALGFSTLSVRLAMVQLYILFMITPLFFVLAQVDRSALEAARDLGANGWKTFREVILPQSMPGVVIGSIFIFVLTMGEYGTVRVIGGNTVSSVGTIVQSKVEIGIQYPQGAASAVLLVVALIVGVFVITRFSNLREEI